MQLTRFDRWLRERFVYETHIYTLSAPPRFPAGFREKPLPAGSPGHFRHLYVTADAKAADHFIRFLKENNQMFSTRVKDRKAWYVSWIAPKDKSVTWRMVWFFLISVSSFFAFLYLKSLWADPELRAIFSDAFQAIKG